MSDYHHYTVRRVPDIDWKIVVSTDPWSASEEFAEAITGDAAEEMRSSPIFTEGIQVEVKDWNDKLFRYKVTAEAAISYFAEESEEATPQVTPQVTPEAPRWIAVGEAMPPDDPEYPSNSVSALVATKGGGVFVAWWSKDAEEWCDPEGGIHSVTHWMALPQPPKGGK